MARKYGHLPGPLDLAEDLELYGSIDGDARVRRDVRLQVCGVIHGNLTVDSLAVAEVFGIVEGDVQADGKFSLHGEVTGKVTGRATIHGESVVNGTPNVPTPPLQPRTTE